MITEHEINQIAQATTALLKPEFDRVDKRIDDFTHVVDLHLTAVELRLDGIEYKLGQIAVFVPYENAFLIPPIEKQKPL